MVPNGFKRFGQLSGTKMTNTEDLSPAKAKEVYLSAKLVHMNLLVQPCPFESGLRKFALDLVIF